MPPSQRLRLSGAAILVLEPYIFAGGPSSLAVMLGRGLRSHRRRHGRRAAEEIGECVERSYRFPGGQIMPHPLDFRTNLIVDANNPVLVLKAWRDHDTHGRAYLGVPHGEDAHVERLSLARSNQETRGRRRKRTPTAKPSSALLGLSGPPEEMLYWGCDPDGTSEAQQALSICLRTLDGQLKGNMTEPDLVPITADDVCFVECKLSLTSLPWSAKGPKSPANDLDTGKDQAEETPPTSRRQSGWEKRWGTYLAHSTFASHLQNPIPKTGTFTSSSGTPSTPACSVTPSAISMRSCYRS